MNWLRAGALYFLLVFTLGSVLGVARIAIVAPRIADLQASDAAYFAANGLILRNPTLINFLDGCALSLPCHADGEAPVGLMLAGAGGADAKVLALGQAVERALAAA